MSESNPIIKLNVGGYKFQTTSSTLLHQDEGNYFTTLLMGSLPTTKDDENAFFIDRDGHIFHYILSFMRNKEIRVSEEDKEDLLREADFYLLPSLVKAIQPKNQFSIDINQSKTNSSLQTNGVYLARIHVPMNHVVVWFNIANTKMKCITPEKNKVCTNVHLDNEVIITSSKELGFGGSKELGVFGSNRKQSIHNDSIQLTINKTEIFCIQTYQHDVLNFSGKWDFFNCGLLKNGEYYPLNNINFINLPNMLIIKNNTIYHIIESPSQIIGTSKYQLQIIGTFKYETKKSGMIKLKIKSEKNEKYLCSLGYAFGTMVLLCFNHKIDQKYYEKWCIYFLGKANNQV